MNITWGAGGSTASKSLELAGICQSLGVPTCLHLTCTNMDKKVLDDALATAKELGIRNILALRGDPPRDEEYWVPGSGDFAHAVDLVKYIKNQHDDFFCVGVAAYPEGHSDGYTDVQDFVKDVPYLVEKVKAGAEFLITQLFYDVDKFVEFESYLRNHESNVFKDIIIVPGLMPINTYQSFLRACKLSHASIPQRILDEISQSATGDDETVKSYGVNLLSSMISEIRDKTEGRVRGFHFYTLNLEKSVAMILDQSNLIRQDDDAIDSDDDLPASIADQKRSHAASQRRQSSLAAQNRVIITDNESVVDSNTDLRIGQVPAGARTSGASEDAHTALAISTGEGTLGREATWDDFPNGRFGDSRSPAYGEIDGYGPSLHVEQSQALKLWGYPVDDSDISKLMIKHITNQLIQIPFSDQALSPETAMIQEELISLNNRGYWSVASQPAVNCTSSNDRIFGWGPPNGKVFQKAFVEFFVSPEKWKALKEKLLKLADGEVSYFAATSTSGLESNLPTGCHSNSVTWGVFPSREVVQSTIIEEESFLAWRDESFGIWREWQRIYPTRSASSKLLGEIADSYYLVSIIHHDFFHEQALWELLECY